jgi:hypothetical protein
VQIEHVDPYTTVSEPEFVDYRDGTKRFERMAAFSESSGTLTGEREPERVTIAVSDGFFSISRCLPKLGARSFRRKTDGMGSRGVPPS